MSACHSRPARPREQASLNSPPSDTERGRPTLCATVATTEIILCGPDGPVNLSKPSDQAVTIVNVMRRSLLFVALASTAMFVTGAVAARPLSPTWSAQWIQANPGQPLVLILNPRAARVCFVGLHGPQGVHPVGWRFQPGGHPLSLTLLTHADATAGSWTLSALCQRRGATGHPATVTISVPAPGGSNVLAAHGDMRVQLLTVPPS